MTPELFLDEYLELGSDRGSGNLLGIQPYMLAADYLNEESFFARLDGYFDAARNLGWTGPKTVAVLPEYLGAWLVTANEKPEVTGASTITQAITRLVGAHPLRFAFAYLASPEKDHLKAALFRMKAPVMARIYQSVFSLLAEKYGVTIAAGAALLPSAYVQYGTLACGKGPLYNTTAVYRPDGTAHAALGFKAHPIDSELPFIKAAPVPGGIFETPAGRLGVLICADAWYPSSVERMRSLGVDLLAVPSYLSPDGAWSQPWGGYNPGPPPAGVDQADVGRLTEGQATRKYTLPGRLASSGARAGVNVFLRGKLWDLGSDGKSVMVKEGAVVETTSERAALLNVWL